MLVGYARVSTADQSLDLQRDALSAAGCERVFEETASGAKTDRAALTGALSFVRDGDILVVWKLDRLGRSLPDLIARVQDLKGKGAGFRSLTEGIDTTSAAGSLVFHIFGALAEFERELIRERTAAGLESARARGRTGGRPETLTRKKVELAARLMRDRETRVEDVLTAVGNVSKATLYRHVSPTGEIRRMPKA